MRPGTTEIPMCDDGDTREGRREEKKEKRPMKGVFLFVLFFIPARQGWPAEGAHALMHACPDNLHLLYLLLLSSSSLMRGSCADPGFYKS
jgi:hypothetical protein